MGKRRRTFTNRLTLFTSMVLMLVTWFSAASAECAIDHIDLRDQDGSVHRFSIELAMTPQEQQRGLMFRTEMAEARGMLFVYSRPQRVAFWMRNTYIPLDLIFVREDGVVQKVHENAVPFDETPIPGGGRVVAVLEINGGLSEKLGIAPGSSVRHPSFDQAESVWPCE